MSAWDRASWEDRWAQALRTHGDGLALRPPNDLLTTAAGDLPAGRALDAGCGHGAETMWLAARGWRVTAVDFATTALTHARATAAAMGSDVAGRIDWVQADLGTWGPPPGAYDLVVCLFVHVAGSVQEMVGRLAAGVARDGTLLMAGHRPSGPGATGAGQVQVAVEQALAVLDARRWDVAVAEDRPREVAGGGVDAVIRARRRA